MRVSPIIVVEGNEYDIRLQFLAVLKECLVSLKGSVSVYAQVYGFDVLKVAVKNFDERSWRINAESVRVGITKKDCNLLVWLSDF